VEYFQETKLRPLLGATLQIFTRPTTPEIVFFSRTWGAERPQVGLCAIFRFFNSPCVPELRRPIAAKFCTVITVYTDFIMQVQKTRGPPLKNFWGQKHVKLEICGRAQHEAARRPKSDWKYSLWG